MKKNDGNKTKEITLIIPESVEVMDITYYWLTSTGISTKSMAALIGRTLEDGAVIDCYRFDESET